MCTRWPAKVREKGKCAMGPAYAKIHILLNVEHVNATKKLAMPGVYLSRNSNWMTTRGLCTPRGLQVKTSIENVQCDILCMQCALWGLDTPASSIAETRGHRPLITPPGIGPHDMPSQKQLAHSTVRQGAVHISLKIPHDETCVAWS